MTITDLHRTVLYDPSDLDARLVWADELEERGQEGWAKFVRTAVVLYRSHKGGADFHLPRATANYFADVTPDVWPFVESANLTLRAGMVREVECSKWFWFDHGREVCAIHPVEVLRLDDFEPRVSHMRDDGARLMINDVRHSDGFTRDGKRHWNPWDVPIAWAAAFFDEFPTGYVVEEAPSVLLAGWVGESGRDDRMANAMACVTGWVTARALRTARAAARVEMKEDVIWPGW